MTPDTLKYLLGQWIERGNPQCMENLEGKSPVDIANFSREDLPAVFATLKMNTGVEIGVERGWYSESLLKANPKLTLFSVDPWAVYDSGHIEHATAETVESFYQQATQRLSQYPGSKIMRMPSLKAAKRFKEDSLDFVYIDGDHGFEAVINDLDAWVPKVRKGGIIAGHDYWGKIHDRYLRVGPAVKLWVKANGVYLWFTIGRTKTIDTFRKDSVRTFLWVKE